MAKKYTCLLQWYTTMFLFSHVIVLCCCCLSLAAGECEDVSKRGILMITNIFITNYAAVKCKMIRKPDIDCPSGYCFAAKMGKFQIFSGKTVFFAFV